jgi:hypothetical protein
MRSLLASFVAVSLFTVVVAAQNSLTGSWNVSFNTPQGAMDAVATFKQDGDKFTGTISGPQGDVAVNNGAVKGNTFTFTLDIDSPNGQMTINLAGEIEGSDAIKGTFDFGQGMGDWTGKRNK